MVESAPVALRTCTVSFVGPTGVRHSVDVTAESVYEAAAVGLSRLRRDGWVSAIAPATQIDVQVRELPTLHCVTVAQIQRWCDGVAISPDEVLKRQRVRELLDGGRVS